MSTEAAIEDGGAALAGAINAKDAAAACYAEDGTLMPPGAPNQVGCAAIQAFWQGVTDAGLTDVKLETTHVYEVGPTHAVAVGALTASMGGQALIGKYVVDWMNMGEGWKLHHDIHNFDA